MKMKYWILLSVLFPIFIISCKSKTGINQKGRVSFYIGDVKINGETPKINQVMFSGAIIETAEKSLCEIIFNNKNIIRIDSKSKVILNIENLNKVIVERGAIFSIFKKLSKDFTVKTPVTMAAIRGTVFYLKVEDRHNTYFCDCNGVISLKGIHKKNEKIIKASHHKAYRVTSNKNKIEINSAKMMYHTDEEMEEVASKIGVTIDWNKISGEK